MRTHATLLLALLALSLSPRPADAGSLSTEGCLASGMAQCRDAEGGAPGRTACLKAALARCDYHCPTLDADCALKQLEKAPLEAWRDEHTAYDLGDACRVMAQCYPPPKLPELPPDPAP